MEKQSLSMNAKNPVSTELLQQLLNASDIGWWQLDFGKREMTCSPLAAELFGTDRTRITFDEVCLLPREEHRAQIYTRCAALKVTDTLDETFVTTNGNKCLQIKAVKVRTDPRTNTRTAFGSVRRVTSGNPESAELAAINQSYKAAQRNYSHLAQLIEHLPIGYLRINILRDKTDRAVDYLLSYINQQAGRILGIRTQDFTGKTASETGVNPQENIPRFMHIPSGDSREHLWQAPDSGRYCRSLIYNTPNNDDELVILLEDITEARRNEEQLRRAKERAEESNRLKSAFLANMSHEIRTPLNAIIGFANLLTSEDIPFSEAEKQEYSRLITSNGDQLLRLISDILDLSKIESNTMEFHFGEHSLHALLTDIYQAQRLCMPEGVRLRLDMPQADTPIVTDASRLKQVVNNLINNAAKFTDNGSITFGFRSPQGCEKVELFVHDTGKGIAQEHLDRIFERFYKADSFVKGVGLGLSICRTITEYLGGAISVESESGKGTRFTIQHPLSRPEAAPRREPAGTAGMRQ